MKNAIYMKEFSYDFKKLYAAFIRDSTNGKRRLANGKRISKSSICNYKSTLNKIIEFELQYGQSLRIRNIKKSGLREQRAEHKYWKKIHTDFFNYLTKQGCLDNYIGFHIKNIKTFFNYLKKHRNIDASALSVTMIVKKEDPPVIVLSTERFKYLLRNESFKSDLPANLSTTLDMFVIGCCTGLRFSDLISLNKSNLEFIANSVYLVVRSKKTNMDTRIKLPDIALERFKLYKNKQKTLLPKLSLSYFNSNLKKIFELAGWIEECPKIRTRNGISKVIKYKNGKNYRFCDLASSHFMRKTAITSMLMLGMPEPLVRKISGHAANSKEFYRYVKYSQSFIDEHTDAVFNKFVN